jgi:hypothetical protein
MKKKLAVFLASAMAVGAIGVGSAAAAQAASPGGPRADCPYAQDGKPIRARDGSGSGVQAKKAGAKAGAKQRARARDGSGLRARTSTPRGDCDGTGPHGPNRSR